MFQRCGETTLDMYMLLPRQLTCPLKSWKLEDYGSYLSLTIELVPFLVTYQILLGNNLPGRNLGNMTQCFEKKLDVSQKSEGEPFSQKAMKYSLENDALVQMILLQGARIFRFQPLIFGGVEVQSNTIETPKA